VIRSPTRLHNRGTQRRKSEQHNPVLPTKAKELRLGVIRTGFDLDHGGLDPRSRNDLLQLFQTNVRRSTCTGRRRRGAPAAPRLYQRSPGIIDYLTARVLRVLLVARLKGKRGMDEIAIDVVELQSSVTCLEGRLDPLRTMIVVYSFVVTRRPPADSPPP
jgi:hypothetical protein